MVIYDAGASSNVTTKSTHAVPEGEMDALLLGITRELVASTPSQRNYKGILIALLVICAICGLILFAIYLLRPPDDGPRVKGRKVTLADTVSKHFIVQPFNGTWISDHELLFRDSRGGISVLNTATRVSKTFLSNTTFRQLNAKKFAVSADQRFVLFTHDEIPVWEHSNLAKFTLYDIENEFKLELNPFEKARDAEQTQLQHAEWGPTGNTLVFVYENDIYYKSSINSNRTIQITSTGKRGIIFNGVPDYIYEVTVFKSARALWMSPNGKFLLYASFNDSLVGEVSYPWYGETSAYPQLRRTRYPKAGTTNPEVTLWAVNLDSDDVLRPIRIITPPVVESGDHYLINVQWLDDQEISVQFLNRQQNTSIYSICNSRDWTCKTIYVLNPAGIGWLEFPQTPLFSTNREKCLLRIPLRDGEAEYFHHVIRLDIKTGKVVPVTNGNVEVTQISAWDQFNHFIYFIGIPPDKPGERHLYRIKDTASNGESICLTCPPPDPPYKREEIDLIGSLPVEISPTGYTGILSKNNTSLAPGTPLQPDTPCRYNQAIFSPSNKLFVRECWGPTVPSATLHQAPSGSNLYILDGNTALREEVANMGLPIIKNFQVQVAGGYLIPTRLYLPPGFREGEEFKFPLILHLTDTLGSQLVTQYWHLTWASYLSSHKNYIVVEIDGRGTGHVGEDKRKPTRDFGDVHVTNQLEVVKYLRNNLSFIDERNVAVWGRGYGGYLSLIALAADEDDIFKCAISVAPITKWEFYNSVNTERYFGMPNITGGYEEGDLIRVVEKLKGKKFMLIHGTADEKVHYQHMLHLTKALIKQGVSFTEQVYPDEGHEFLGVKEHLYNTMENYLDLNFDIPDWEDWEKVNFLGMKM